MNFKYAKETTCEKKESHLLLVQSRPTIVKTETTDWRFMCFVFYLYFC